MLEEGRRIVDRTGGYRGLGIDELLEREHELRASLSGIEAVAVAMNDLRDRLRSEDVDQLALAIASEARRLRLMLVPQAKQRADFDLAEAIRPAIIMTAASGVVVRDAVPNGMWAHGCRDDVAQVVFALLDNARVHAAPSVVDVRGTDRGGITSLFIEDRGPGMARISAFRRGRRGPQSPGSGLGLHIARRLMVDQGGSLTVNARPGGGASFMLTLPTSPSPSPERLPQVAQQPKFVQPEFFEQEFVR